MRLLLFALFASLFLSALAAAIELKPKYAGSTSLTLGLEWDLDSADSGGMHHLTVFAFPSTSFQYTDYNASDAYTAAADEWGNKRLTFEWPAFQGRKVIVMDVDAAVDYAGSAEVAANYERYLDASDLVIISPEISAQAAATVEGSATEFEKAVRLAEWVHNAVVYDSSLWGRRLDSEQVFNDRRGVCSEYAHLLLAMLRSQGIPARFVAGFVYSGESWGPHAWVEAVVGGKWVPFDPTFNEAGVLDATHVKFAQGRDQGDVTEEITEGFAISKPAVQVTVNEVGAFSLPFKLGALEAPQSVGAGSLEAMSLSVESKSDAEQAVSLSLNAPSRPTELAVAIAGDDDRLLYLPPRGKRSAEWSVAFPVALQEGFIYNFSFTVNSMGANASVEVQGRKDAAANVVESVSIKSLASRLEGNALTITADLENSGSTQAGALVSCTLDGDEKQSSVQIGVGGRRAVQFVYPLPKNKAIVYGELSVVTQGQTVKQPFQVSLNSPSAAASAQPAGGDNLPAFAAIAVLVVIAIAVIAKRFRGYEEV